MPPATPPILDQPAGTGMSGCAKAAIIGVVLIVVIGIGLAVLFLVVLNRVADDVEASFTEEPCQFITSAEASEAIGAEVEATSGDSALGAVLGLVRDTRLLEGAPSCFISEDDGPIQIWLAVYDGGDAAEVFATGAEVAEGQVVTQETTESGTLTVETDAFRGEDVPGLGEEAFCTELGAVVSGGVFARAGERVVYVSALPVIEDEGEGALGDPCQMVIPVAEALLDQP
jgi:hypothetical protein